MIFERWRVAPDRLRKLSAIGFFVFAPAVSAGPILPNLWYEFGFANAGIAATGCDPADPAGPFCIPSGGTPSLFLDAPPWTFNGGAVLTVTDAFTSGDRFELFDFGTSIGLTSLPSAAAVVDCGDDPEVCLATPGISTATFALANGAHSITLVPVLSPGGGGAGYLRATVAAVPEPGSLLLAALALLSVYSVRRLRAKR